MKLDESSNPRPSDDSSIILPGKNWVQDQVVIFICNHTPKCREVVQILSERMDHKLSLWMRFKLRMHYLMCCWCQRYEEHLNYMRKVAREFPEKVGEVSDATLPVEAKERLKEALRQ